MVITFPTNTAEIIDQMRGAIGRDVTFNMVTYSGCSACGYDPQANASINSYCPICSGLYYIPSYSGITVSGHITWKNADIVDWSSAGKYFEGDCRLQIKYTLNTLDMVKEASNVTVDDKLMRIDEYSLRGVKVLNRIVIQLSEEERDA